MFKVTKMKVAIWTKNTVQGILKPIIVIDGYDENGMKCVGVGVGV
jgi:hypothetical protein